ncbi:MAG: radical SAM protein [Candidatus Anstonellales archaeon]
MYEPLADTIISGEAEYIWRQFCNDFENGVPNKLYVEKGIVDLKDSPVPRYDLLKLHKYRGISMQFSRGCPFNCEFCDIIVMFGRKHRTKCVNQIQAELDLLRKLNVNNVFFVDDNLIGNKKNAIELFEFLYEYNNQLKYKFHFSTEVSLNIAYNDKLISLMAKSGFEWVFVGIETTNEESLKETGKFQNMLQDIVFSIRKIYSYGVDVLGGFIIGFDHDKVDIFQKQFKLILNTGIQTAMIGLLVAPPKTRLYERLIIENRIIKENDVVENTKLSTNIIPKIMSFDEMINGYRKLYKSLYTSKMISQKIKNKVEFMKKPLFDYYESKLKGLKILWNLLFFGILPGGAVRIL